MTNVTVQEALKAAIKAMEYHTEQTRPIQKTIDTLALCKSALSEVEKCEPVITNTNHGFVMTDRNFTYAGNGYIHDNNFDHDAALKISGDFAEGDLDKYAQMIVKQLNTKG